MTRAEAGRIGEAAAARWMEEQGFTLLERNWRCREGELDLIAMESGVLVIAEVRSLREGSRFGTALESIHVRKQLQVRKVARIYLQNNGWTGRAIRFDAAAVTLDRSGRSVVDIRYIRSAF